MFSPGRSVVAGFERMPRNSGNAVCRASFSLHSGSVNQTWPTTALGKPYCALTSCSQLVSFDLLVAVVFRFDMHRLDDAEGLRVAPVILRLVASPDAQIVAENLASLGLVGEPGIIVSLEVPQMMVGVDDLEVLERCDVSHELDSAREPKSRRTNSMIEAPTRSWRIDKPASSEKTPVLQTSNDSTEKVRLSVL